MAQVDGGFRVYAEVTGDKELDAVINAMCEEDGPKSINTELRKACQDAIESIVRPAVMSLIKHRYGFLESQVIVKAGDRKKNFISYWIGFPDPLFQGETYYGGFLEFGTEDRYHDASGIATRPVRHFTGQVKEDSFLRAALYPNADRIVARVREHIRVWIAANGG